MSSTQPAGGKRGTWTWLSWPPSPAPTTSLWKRWSQSSRVGGPWVAGRGRQGRAGARLGVGPRQRREPLLLSPCAGCPAVPGRLLPTRTSQAGGEGDTAWHPSSLAAGTGEQAPPGLQGFPDGQLHAWLGLGVQRKETSWRRRHRRSSTDLGLQRR